MICLLDKINLSISFDYKKDKISPFLFGHFIEHMHDCVDPGIHAQTVQSQRFSYPDSNCDGISDPWMPLGNGSFSSASDVLFNGETTQRIESINGDDCGIYQEIVLFTATYQCDIWGYSDTNLAFYIDIQQKEQSIFLQRCFLTPNTWKKHSFVFQSTNEGPGRLILKVHGKGTLWIGRASLMQQDAVCTVWPNVMRYIEDLRPSIIRYPGGCFADCYHWQDGIGDVSLRPPRKNLHWGGMEENGFGTDEFLQLCEKLNCEPIICVNFGSGTPEEAAQWVEYCNGDCTTEFGSIRAKNGHPHPYGVKYWDIGNEMFAHWEIGHCDIDTYCTKFKSFAAAMSKADPHIQFIVCGGDGNIKDQSWNDCLIKNLQEFSFFIGIHYYTPLSKENYFLPEQQYYAVAGAPKQYEKRLQDTVKKIEGIEDRVKLAITEWNCNYENTSLSEQTMEAAICNAGMLNVFFRNCANIHIANISDLVNGWAGGIIRSKQGRCYGTPTYFALKMYAESEPQFTFPCIYNCKSYNTISLGNLEADTGIPYVDIVSAESKNGLICIYVVNRSLTDSAVIALPRELSASKGVILQSNDYTAHNSFEKEEVKPVTINYKNEQSIFVSPCSINVIYCKRMG